MIIVQLSFYFFAVVALCAALVVVTARNPIRSVLALVVSFFAMAAIWMILTAEFLALILLLVYVGAVMTLFLFVVMMLNIDLATESKNFSTYLPLGVLAVLIIIGVLVGSVASHFSLTPMPALPAADFNNIALLGEVLYTDYAYPFELAGIILLAAIIAALSLAHRSPRQRKSQEIARQLRVLPEDRLRLLKMASEPRQKNTGPAAVLVQTPKKEGES